jgi:hypothetical protein
MKDNILKETAIIPIQELLRTEKYYQQVRGPLQSRMSALRDCATEYGMTKCQGNTGSNFPADACFAAGQLQRQVPRAGTSLSSDRPTQSVFNSRTLCKQKFNNSKICVYWHTIPQAVPSTENTA